LCTDAKAQTTIVIGGIINPSLMFSEARGNAFCESTHRCLAAKIAPDLWRSALALRKSVSQG
jgi:hypothetical protein